MAELERRLDNKNDPKSEEWQAGQVKELTFGRQATIDPLWLQNELSERQGRQDSQDSRVGNEDQVACAGKRRTNRFRT